MSGRRLSFCMVTTFYPPHHFGGDATYVYRLSTELARRGHRVTVVCTPDAFTVLGGREAPAPPQHDGIHVERLSSRPASLGPLVTYLTGRPGLRGPALRRIFERERFDVTHFHNVSLVGGPGVLAHGTGVKLYTTHEHWLVCPMHTLWRYNREPCPRPTCLRCTLSYRRPPQLWRYGSLLERNARHVDLFLSPSRFTLEMHRRRGFDRPMRHLPSFVQEPEPAPAGAAQPERPYFLVVARLERLKGLRSLVETFRSYHAADLLIVGDGAEGPELRRRAETLQHVRFLGRKGFLELGALYRGATAVIAPSEGYETFGMTSIEAFAHGTPAIVYDRGALPEAVRESGAGFVYATEEELLDALERLRQNPELRDELGSRGYSAFRDHWSPEAHLGAYFRVIEEAGEHRAARAAGGGR
jgi:glycosyltransferase involved in cell wall biosynthesis